MNLEFTVDKQTLKRTDRNRVVNESIQYLRLSFTFSSDWTNSYSRYVFFRKDGVNYPYPLTKAFIDYGINVPKEFLTDDRLIFGVYGVRTSSGEVTHRITTNLLSIPLGDSGLDKEFGEIDPTVYTETVIERIQSEISAIDEAKVDKINGKGLSSNDYTDTDKKALAALKIGLYECKMLSTNDYADEDLNIVWNVPNWLNQKVDKETGKGLSSNDFSNGYKSFIDQSRTVRLNSTANTSTTSKYVVTIPGTDFNVAHGTMVGVLNFTGDNTADATMNVNSAGDKPIYKDNAPITAGAFPNKSFKLFVYVTWNSINSGNGAWLMIN